MRRDALLRLAPLVVAIGCGGASAPSSSSAQVPSTGTVSNPAAVSATRRTAITNAVAAVAPTVVTVQTEMVERVPADAFEQFFGGASAQRVTPGLGSGFITRGDGVIVTNAHVVSGASRISVAMRDGTTYPAKVVGIDETNDLAVLKIDAKGLPTARLGSSDSLLIGEWAIAIGNPYGFLLGNPEPSVTVGVVSGTGRNLVARSEGSGAYFDMVQTDASINPGNSGGPLVDADGEVIGVNSSIYSPTGGSVGLGFAIPINRVKRVMQDLLEHGAVRRPWVGIQLRLPDSPNPRDALAAGAVVRYVVPGSPAARAGLAPGDQIVRAGTRAIRNPFDWEAELLDLSVGQTVPLRIRRGSREFEVQLRVADLPEVSAPKVEVLREMQLVTVTPQIRAERGLRSARGALVYQISDRVSEEIGLSAGDVIVQINRTPITSAEDAARAIDYYSDKGAMRVYFEHGGRIYSTDIIIQ